MKLPEVCVTCGNEITMPKGSIHCRTKLRNTPKVCQVCLRYGISRDKEWGCGNCMNGDSKTGIFYHKPKFCPGLKKRNPWGGKT